MRKKYSIMILLTLLLLMQPFVSTNTGSAKLDAIEALSPTEFSTSIPVKQDIGVGGEEQIKTDFNPNYGFEETTTNGGPDDYNYYGSAYQYADEAYMANIYSGNYACDIQAFGTEQFYANAYLYRNIAGGPLAYLQEDIEMSFWYFLVSNPDVASGTYIYLRIRFYDSVLFNSYTIYYYLSTSSVSSNSSNTAYFDLSSSTSFGVWENFQRDITADYTAVFSPPSANIYYQYVYFYATSNPNSTGMTEFIIDDVSVENAATFDWCSDNGGFEQGDGSNWSSYDRGPASIYQTTDNTEGTYAANLTATTVNDYAGADAYVESYWGDWYTPPLGSYVHQPGDLTISFDWKYNEYNPSNYHYAIFYVQGSNGTYDLSLNWFLGEDTDIVPWGNSTYATYAYYYYAAPGFGVRNSWFTLTVDIYEYLNELNITNMPIIYCGVQIVSGNYAGAITELLVDDFHIIADPVGDPSFEEDWYYSASNSIPSWVQNDPDPYVSLTSDAHSGDNAANISAYSSSGNVRIYRYTNLEVANNLFSDIWWKLDDISITDNNYAQIRLDLDDGSNIFYILGMGSSYTVSNYTDNCYYIVDNYNEIGVWNNLFRDIAGDINEAFGDGDWSIDQIRLEVYTSDTDLISLLIDDVHFVRDTRGPQLISAVLLNSPIYYNDVNMEIMAVDSLSRVGSVTVYYRTDVTWTPVVGSMMGMYFLATIPKQDFGNIVEYYIVMQDLYGFVSTDNNAGAYYSYEIIDDVEPTIAIVSVRWDENQLVQMRLHCHDKMGSGIDHIEIYDNGTYLDTLTYPSYPDEWYYNWNTSIVQESGIHILSAIAYDMAGNTAEDSFSVSVDFYEPPGPFVSFFQSWGTLIGAAIVGTAWVTVIAVKFFKKPKT